MKKQKQKQKNNKKSRKWMWYIKAQSLRPVTGTRHHWCPAVGIAEIIWSFKRYLAAWSNDCSRFRGRMKEKYFMFWLIFNTHCSLHSGSLALAPGPEGIPWIDLTRGSTVPVFYTASDLLMSNRCLIWHNVPLAFESVIFRSVSDHLPSKWTHLIL